MSNLQRTFFLIAQSRSRYQIFSFYKAEQTELDQKSTYLPTAVVDSSIFPIFVDITVPRQWPIDILEDYLIGSK